MWARATRPRRSAAEQTAWVGHSCPTLPTAPNSQPCQPEEGPRPLLPPPLHQARRLPYDEVEWELRLAQITDAQGNVIFEQKDVEVPKDWSMTATNIVASKYLHGKLGTPERETGVRQLVTRVAETIRDWGMAQGYFNTPEDGATFHDELVHILVRQYAAFNSPVWFNVGCDRIEPNSDAQNWHWNPKPGTRRVRRHRLHHAAVLRLLHQLGERFARFHPHPGQDRRHALQVGIRHRHQSFPAAFFHRRA